MKLKRDGVRRPMAGAALLAATVLLASCGGGEQVETFTANRVLALGDESSVITADGKKYTVNSVVVNTTTFDCVASPIWVQYVARRYDLVFPQCNPDNIAAPSSRIRALAGAQVGDVTAQIDAQVAEGGFESSDLVTILAGANDILAAYQRFTAGATEDQVLADMTQAGDALGAQVNRVADLGGKVLIATVPSLGLTPFGVKEEAANAGRADLLGQLTFRFNSAMRGRIRNDGRRIGLVLLDERVALIVRATTSLGYSNVTDAACAIALPNCSTATLVDDPDSDTTPKAKASGFTWLWADDTHLSAGAQATFGQLATDRVSDNPF